jgi:oligoribonuclease
LHQRRNQSGDPHQYTQDEADAQYQLENRQDTPDGFSHPHGQQLVGPNCSDTSFGTANLQRSRENPDTTNNESRKDADDALPIGHGAIVGIRSEICLSKVSSVTDRLVWIDCEMTGLDLGADALIEVAALVTDSELNVLGEGVDLVIKPPQEALDQMIPFVRQMHVNSGLLEELANGISLAEAEEQVLDYLKQHCPEGSRPPLAGNSVSTDRAFLARDMTKLDEFLHYRIIDVSSVKELSRRWYPKAYFASPTKRGNHRALADIQESIEELRYYREAVFVPAPGPDSNTATEIAARHAGAVTGLGPETQETPDS